MKTRSRLILLLTGFAAMLVVGCSSAEKPASSLTEAQRDTVLSKSEIPGAQAVGHAFDAAGKEATHAAELDSMVH